MGWERGRRVRLGQSAGLAGGGRPSEKRPGTQLEEVLAC